MDRLARVENKRNFANCECASDVGGRVLEFASRSTYCSERLAYVRFAGGPDKNDTDAFGRATASREHVRTRARAFSAVFNRAPGVHVLAGKR